jgi:phosphate butyryltransferase
MMTIKTLGTIVDIAGQKGKKRIAVAVAQDEDVLVALKSAMKAGICQPILVGDKDDIRRAAETALFDLSTVEIIHESDRQSACETSVKLIRGGQADILMKGLVSTGILVKSLLDKEFGLVKGSLLSHLAFFETPNYHKLLCITDAALNISPDFNDKVGIVRNAVDIYHRLGIDTPQVAILAPVETVNPKMEATVHGAMLTQMQRRNQIEGCLIDGPLALDVAVSYDAARHKGLISAVAGDADILVTPDLNSGNMLYKSLNFLGGAVAAAIVAGASVPVVLTSRADQDKSKFLSIALSVALA